jgi:hypothetical protein
MMCGNVFLNVGGVRTLHEIKEIGKLVLKYVTLDC